MKQFFCLILPYLADKLSTIVSNVERDAINLETKQLILQFYEFMKGGAGTSDRYQNNNLKALVGYNKFLGPLVPFLRKQLEPSYFFFGYKNKNSEDDPDIRWIMLKKKIIAL